MADHPDCIFCKLIRGEFPVYTVYEDDNILALLDIQPVRPGHTLVIPKIHIDHFTDVPEDIAAEMMVVAQKLGRKMMDVLDPKPLRIGYMVMGFDVPHAHLHVVPMYEPHDVTAKAFITGFEGNRPVFGTDNLAMASDEERESLQSLLKIL